MLTPLQLAALFADLLPSSGLLHPPQLIFLSEVGHAPPRAPRHYTLMTTGDPPQVAPRGPGRGVGLYALVHVSVLPRVLCDPCSDSRCLWLRVRGGAGAAGDLFVGGVYLPPFGSPQWRAPGSDAAAAFDALRDQTLSLQARGRVLLMGDFNARLGTMPDIQPGADTLLARAAGGPRATSLDPSIPASRAAAEGTRNAFGSLLINTLCLPTASVILNGRAPSGAGRNDVCTYTGPPPARATSCVDYAIADPRLYPSVRSFEILA